MDINTLNDLKSVVNSRMVAGAKKDFSKGQKRERLWEIRQVPIEIK